MAFTSARFNERLQTSQESFISKRKKMAKYLTHISFYKEKKNTTIVLFFPARTVRMTNNISVPAL